MKKYLFLIAGLLAFAVSGEADAAVKKIGRQKFGINPFVGNTFGGDGHNHACTVSCSPSQCKVGCNCLSMDDFKAARCSGNDTVINTNGSCSCNTIHPACSGEGYCVESSSQECLTVTEWTEKCGDGKEGYRQGNGTCGCRTPSQPNDSCPTGQYKHEGSCVSVCAAVTCRDGYHTVVNGNSCCCQENGGGASTCDPGYVYHTIIKKCVPQKCVLNCANCHATDSYCLACNSGHYLNYNDGTCPACSTAIANCTSCSTEGGKNGAVICLSCSGDLVPNSAGTACVAAGGGDDPNISDTCQGSEVFHPVLKRCVLPACFTNCAYPNSACEKQIQLGYCPSCAAGHYMEYDMGGCPACSDAIPGCLSCTSSNGGLGKDGYITNVTCTDCGNGKVYHPVLNRCVVANCPQHCAEGCQSNYCSRCEDNYQLNNEGGCDYVGGGLQGGTPGYNAQD